MMVYRELGIRLLWVYENNNLSQEVYEDSLQCQNLRFSVEDPNLENIGDRLRSLLELQMRNGWRQCVPEHFGNIFSACAPLEMIQIISPGLGNTSDDVQLPAWTKPLDVVSDFDIDICKVSTCRGCVTRF